MQPPQRFCWMLVLCGLAGNAFSPVMKVACAGAALPAAVRTDLEGTAAALSPLRVKWTQQLASPLPLEALLTKINDSNKALLLPNDVTYIRSGDKFYHHDEYRTDVDGKLQIQRTHTAFDGEKLRSGSDDSYRLNCFRIDTAQHFLEWTPADSYVFYTEYFDAAGITIGNRAGDLFAPPKSQILSLLDAGGELTVLGEELLDKQNCIVLAVRDATGTHKYWLAPALGHAVVRHLQSNSQGQTLQDTRNSDFVTLKAPSLSLPRRSAVAYYTWHRIPDVVEPEPIISQEFEIKILERTGIADSQFVIDTTKGGSRVADATIAGEKDQDGFVQFNVPVTEADLVAGLQTRRRWFIGANLIFALGLGAWAYFRRWRLA